MDFYQVAIQRQSTVEKVYVVAEFGRGLLFFEDIEESFELSQLDENGIISSYSASQFELRHILGRLQTREAAACTEIGSASFGQELFTFLIILAPYWRVSDDAWRLADGSHLGGISVLRNYGGDVMVVEWDAEDGELARRLATPRGDERSVDPDRRVVVIDDRTGARFEEVRRRIAPIRVVPWSQRQLLAGIVIKDAP